MADMTLYDTTADRGRGKTTVVRGGYTITHTHTQTQTNSLCAWQKHKLYPRYTHTQTQTGTYVNSELKELTGGRIPIRLSLKGVSLILENASRGEKKLLPFDDCWFVKQPDSIFIPQFTMPVLWSHLTRNC